MSDLSSVSAVALDADDNETNVTTRTDFDDTTDKAVVAPTAAQADENSNILITPNTQNGVVDSTMVIVKFETPAMDKLNAANYSLKQGENYLVASKGTDGKWSIGVVAGDDRNEFNFAGSTTGGKDGLAASSGIADPRIATIDENTGVITLNKKFVKGKSLVDAKVQDAYGNQADMADFTTKHSDPAQPDVFVTPPTISNAGEALIGGVTKALLDVTPSTITKEQDGQPAHSNFKTEVTHNGNTLVIKYVPETEREVIDADTGKPVMKDGQPMKVPVDAYYELEGISSNDYSAKGIKDFNKTSGVLTLIGDDKATISAITKKTVGNTEYSSDTALGKFTVTPPEEDYSVDQAIAVADNSGAVEIRPGSDNTKVVVDYTKEDGTTEKATLTYKNGTWTSDKPNDFDIQNDKIVLKNSALKDGTAVTVTGSDNATTPNVAEPSTAYAKVDDATPSTTNKPTISDQADNRMVISRGVDNGSSDNASLKVGYTKAGNANPAETGTIISKLQPDGSWTLVDSGNNPVPDYIATVDADGNISLNTAVVKPGTQVTAQATNNSGVTSDADPKTTLNGKTAENSNFILKSIHDGEFTVEPTNKGQEYAIRFMGIEDSSDNQKNNLYVVTLVVSANARDVSGIKMYVQENMTMGSTHIAPTNDDETDPIPTGFATIKDGVLTVKSAPTIGAGAIHTTEYWWRPWADGDDTRIEFENNRPDTAARNKQDTNENLKLTAAYGGKDVFKGKPNGDASIFLLNTVEGRGNPGSATNGDGLPVEQAIKPLLDNNVADKQGAVKITPQGNANRLYVTYTNEDNTIVRATLAKQNDGSWKVVSGNEKDFDVKNRDPLLRATAVKDQPAPNDGSPDAVSVVAAESGKRNSEAATTRPAENPPANDGLYEDGGTLVTDTEKPSSLSLEEDDEFLSDDIIWRFGWRESAKRSSAFNQLVRDIKTMGGSFDITRPPGKDAAGSKFTFTDDTNTLIVNGSIGDTSGYGLLKYRPRTIEMDFKNGDDILSVGNDIGEDDPQKSRTHINMGDGNDLISVGTNNSYFRLYENKDLKNTENRYKFYDSWSNNPDANAREDSWEKNEAIIREAAEKEGYTPVDGVEHRFFYNQGGRIVAADIDAGDGNDVLVVEGKQIADFWVTKYAVDDSRIKMGSGNDSFILAENARYLAVSDNKAARGQIRDTVLDMGDGNDYVKTNAIRGETNIKLGDGDDHADIWQMLDAKTRVEGGTGNDTVTIEGEARNNATIDLGAGDDTFVFKPNIDINIMAGGSGKESLFEGIVDGGDGYDKIVLATPKHSAVKTLRESNLNATRIKNIEEIWMEQNTVFDVDHDALSKDGYNGPLKIRASGDDLSSTNGAVKHTRFVDIGGSQNNDVGTDNRGANRNDSDGKNSADLTERHYAGQHNSTWEKTGSQTEDGVTYNVYTFRGDQNNALWIDSRIDVI